MRKIRLTEEQFSSLVKALVKEGREFIGDVKYEDVAKQVWSGEIEPIGSLHDPKEEIFHYGNVTGSQGYETYGRLFKGVETGKIYFWEL